jgi:pyruvate/2-oxoglutarate dehydrogenase complex dihydrolipoamide acyltransferase (E2) component
MTRIIIPQLDVNLVDVTVTSWRKQPGETVAAGESLAELTTDKAVYELEAPASGTLLAVYAAEKSVVPTGFIAGLIGAPGEDDAAIEADNAALMLAYRGPAAASAPARERPARVRATPRARRLAQEKGLDLAKIQTETGAEIIDETVLAPYLNR